MLFCSAVFIFVFLPVVFLFNCIVGKKYSNVLLLLASLFFYAYGETKGVILMIGCIVINWGTGVAIEKGGEKGKKIALISGIVCNIGILGYCKYFGNLPVGISFYTFQAISYIIDIYRGETKAAGNLINVALYISFFPQLIAGPIVKYKDINRQIEERSVTWLGVSDGFKRFIYGLAKKVLVANTLGACVDAIYSYKVGMIDGRMAWVGVLAYAFQIYYDFSGYSDMAIGLGRMFGFVIPENFRYPYLSGSISEFWRRWHISLGSWFREYLYIPLGGSRKGERRTYINLAIVFFCTGLWHGGRLSFVLWGIYHGIFVIIERAGLKKILDKHKMLSVVYCFTVVSFGWVLFRAEDVWMGIRYMEHMLFPWKYLNATVPVWEYMTWKTAFIGICAILGAGVVQAAVPEKWKEKWRGSVPEALYIIGIFVLSLGAMASSTYSPFIYFRF